MTKKVALIVASSIIGVVLIFHFLIFTEQIPYDKVWAGKVNSVEEMKSFEVLAILINTFILIVFFMKFKLLQKEKENKTIDLLIWIFAVFFALNTIGNLFSKSMTEFIVGTFLTLTLSVLSIVIAKKKKTATKYYDM